MSGFRLGKFFGINVHIDWSWLLIFTLVTWSLASTFRQVHPEWTGFDQLALALVAALLFFLSVLAHEIAHSLVANARGHPVRRITMFLFGGVSNIQKEPTTPWNEFIITIVVAGNWRCHPKWFGHVKPIGNLIQARTAQHNIYLVGIGQYPAGFFQPDPRLPLGWGPRPAFHSVGDHPRSGQGNTLGILGGTVCSLAADRVRYLHDFRDDHPLPWQRRF